MGGLTSQQEEDFNWFMENRKQLFKQYGESFVVIENKSVIKAYEGIGDEVEDRALEDMHKIKKSGTFIVQGLTDDEAYYFDTVRCASL